MKALLLLLLALALVTESFSQVSLYSENFDSGGTPFALNAADLGGANVVNTWLINNSYLGGSGTITCLGFPFTFTINSVSNQPAGITNSPNSNYMHITAQSGIASAIFCGSYAAADGICVLEEPNFTKMSAPINTIGYSNVSLDFWWACGGSPDAYGEVYYSLDGGASWVLKQSLYNNSTSWTQATTLSDPLWDDAASLMIGYNFINIAAGTAMDPGFSIDDVSITGLVAVNTIATANDFTPSSWCHGPEVAGAISFVSTGIYNPSNIYYAELSDGAGSFAAPITIGSLTSSATGSLSIPVTVSGAASAGSGYRVRVVATDPSTTGTDNASDIVIYTPPTVTQTPFSAVCIDNGPLTLSGGSPVGGTYSGSTVSGSTFDPGAAAFGNHSITYYYIDVNGCDGSAVETIDVNDLPIVTLGIYANVCLAEAAFTLTGGSPASGVYSGTGVTGGLFDPTTAGAGMHTISYAYTDANGCTGVDSQTILVEGCLSLDEEMLSSVMIYPNPTEATFSITSPVDELVMTDMNGRIMKSFRSQTSYDISDLAQGVYLVRIRTNGTQLLRRVILR